MTEDDFTRAILADPENDTLRLVYADWLEESGDPRSEFLRLEVALASAAPGAAGRAALEKQCREAAADLDGRWLRAVSRTATGAARTIDVDDDGSIAFAFLEHLYNLRNEIGLWPSVELVGHDLGLSDNELEGVIQHLRARRMLQWRSEPTRRGIMPIVGFQRSAAISARGRKHVEAMLGRPRRTRSARRNSREGDG